MDSIRREEVAGWVFAIGALFIYVVMGFEAFAGAGVMLIVAMIARRIAGP